MFAFIINYIINIYKENINIIININIGLMMFVCLIVILNLYQSWNVKWMVNII